MLVYGFGSYFFTNEEYRDIDILIVHESDARESCKQAIDLKKYIIREIEGAHVSMLSKSAEAHFNFIYTSRAILLGVVDEKKIIPYVNEIVSKVAAFRKA